MPADFLLWFCVTVSSGTGVQLAAGFFRSTSHRSSSCLINAYGSTWKPQITQSPLE